MDLFKAYLTVGNSKTDAGEGRTIPLNSDLLEAMVDYSKWYTKRFHTIKPEWYVFPARIGKPATGQKRPLDPTRPMVTLKTSWNNVRTKTKVMGRWRDNRHTLITDLAESGAGDETIRRGDFKDFLLLREWSFASIVFLGVSIRQLIRVKVNIQRTP